MGRLLWKPSQEPSVLETLLTNDDPEAAADLSFSKPLGSTPNFGCSCTSVSLAALTLPSTCVVCLSGDDNQEMLLFHQGFSRVRVSLNGVFVNGVRVKKGMVKELNAGDEVLLVCGNGGVCRVPVRIGFVILGVVFKEEVVFKSNEVVLERPQLLGTMASSGQSQGSVSSGKRSKRVFALQSNDVRNLDCDISTSKCGNVIGRANFLSSQCRLILNSDDPISCIRQSPISDSGGEGSYGNTKFPVLMFSNKCKSSVGGDFKVKTVEPIFGKEQIPCDTRAGLIQSASITFHSEKVVAIEDDHEQMDLCIHGDHLGHKDSIRTSSKNVLAGDNSNCKALSLNSLGAENAPCIDSVDMSKHWGYSCSPPGKKFYLNRLEFMDCGSTERTCISLPELLHPVESISQIFVATFTSDVLWFLSYCEIPSHIPVTIACHNTERCWSSSPDKRTCVPFPDFPNLVVVFPPFPETVAFGENCKKQGIACHHPKLFVLQREDSIRVIITSANLVAKQLGYAKKQEERHFRGVLTLEVWSRHYSDRAENGDISSSSNSGKSSYT
ncbi:hypothetical protein JRO89_XS01G0387000 [Xanthoceras sorbifolium]|uniref:FHA domain-containing protein n=1 Tax=Xanthoceras sorbifolium TaxID=99658 RepID=A0ABQ8IP46_9ROSI|nr:hypothetical protein JRO89_XS01G0387000 [Xanthoceras sorbifolium]